MGPSMIKKRNGKKAPNKKMNPKPRVARSFGLRATGSGNFKFSYLLGGRVIRVLYLLGTISFSLDFLQKTIVITLPKLRLVSILEKTSSVSLCKSRKRVSPLLPMVFIAVLFFSGSAHCSSSFTNLIFGKQAVSYTDKVLPEILEEWSLAKFTHYAHPQFYQKISYDKVKQLFFQFKKLGILAKYHGAKGEVVTEFTSEGEKVMVGKYTALANFANGTATISLIIQKSSRGWNIVSFFVESESFNTFPSSKQSADEIIADGVPLTKNELEKAVQGILGTDSVQKRRNVNKLFQLADMYLNEGNDEKALMLFEQALRGDAAHFEKQLIFAKLLLNKKQQERAISVLSSINRFTENSSLFHKSSELLKSLGKELPVLFEAEADFRNDIEIMLIPVGTPQRQILEELRIALQNETGIAVFINNKSVEHDEFDKKLTDRWITEIYTTIEKDLTQAQRSST